MMLKKLLKWLIGTVLAIILLTVIGAVAMLHSGDYQDDIIYTGSMETAIPPGSVVIEHTGHYHVGQVVVFRIANEEVAHRLLAIRADGTIVTKGDANPSADPQHPPKSNIIGGVVYAPQYLGFAVVCLRQPTGIASVLLIVLMFVQLPGLLRRAPSNNGELAPKKLEPAEK